MSFADKIMADHWQFTKDNESGEVQCMVIMVFMAIPLLHYGVY